MTVVWNVRSRASSFFPGTNGAPVSIGTSFIRGSQGFDNLTLDTFEVSANVTGTPGNGGGDGGGGDGGPVSVPEPASLSLMLASLLGAAVVRRRRKIA